jgi:hypothetical protein
MNGPGTNGGSEVTNGGAENRLRFRFPPWLWVAYACVLIAVSAVIGSSYWLEARRFGAELPAWRVVVDEATSITVVFLITPLVFAWAERLHPRRIGWLKTGLGHLAGLVAFSAAHIGGMTLLRVLVYPMFSGSYGIDWSNLPIGLFYEGRKDALAYIGMVIGARLLAKALRKPAIKVVPAPASSPATPRRIEIRDGARRIWVEPDEILWIEAAGNYVELHLAGRSLLQRQTLSALENELADLGFVRIHRSRLVNRKHVRATASNDSGDFTVTLSDGRQIAGGRRWRDAITDEPTG